MSLVERAQGFQTAHAAGIRLIEVTLVPNQLSELSGGVAGDRLQYRVVLDTHHGVLERRCAHSANHDAVVFVVESAARPYRAIGVKHNLIN